MKLTKKKLQKWSKEELIQALLLRNDDAKDYEKYICELEGKQEDE